MMKSANVIAAVLVDGALLPLFSMKGAPYMPVRSARLLSAGMAVFRNRLPARIRRIPLRPVQ